MNETIKSIKSRRSVRNYQTAEIPKEILEELIDCARLAPTARNTQPWEFIIIKDKDTLDNIGKLASHGHFIKDAAACIIVCS
ncbi:MAG: nitroreductase family protein, partial [Candidatus Aenigmarchaeota archaeon]|nr:nitroreductase family protein [Candidatus Aenigmarchaeota archaeon]